jgi:tripartite-type tricarboxylate transporter receptor subunit TctC
MAKVPAPLQRVLHAAITCVKVLRAAIVYAAVLLPAPARAQEFPSRPIKLIVPFLAGGGIDTTARVVAQALGGVLGQQSSCRTRAGRAAPSRRMPW